MDDLERKLAGALSRQDPPAWFEAKVLGAAANQSDSSQRSPRSLWSRLLFAGRLRWVSAMAAGLVLVAGVAWQHERTVREREAGEPAEPGHRRSPWPKPGRLSRSLPV